MGCVTIGAYPNVVVPQWPIALKYPAQARKRCYLELILGLLYSTPQLWALHVATTSRAFQPRTEPIWGLQAARGTQPLIVIAPPLPPYDY